MSQNKTNWWYQRISRSVDNLQLWNGNPRFDPSNELVKIIDFIEELIADKTEKNNFLDLIKSIANRGFLDIDPIVVWQNTENKKFIVAEGNRRVLALKLLRSPEMAPRLIKKQVIEQAQLINKDNIKKIKVCLAPSYDVAQWYVLQRHSGASLQNRWQRLQQQRYIIDVYDKNNQSIEETVKLTGIDRAHIVNALYYVKLRDIATGEAVSIHLTDTERKKLLSHRINMTVLERWFGKSQIKEAWHIEFDDGNVVINADLNSFYAAYAAFLKLMLSENNNLGYDINTRTLDSKFQEIFDFLPKVLEKGENADFIQREPFTSTTNKTDTPNNPDPKPELDPDPKPDPKPDQPKFKRPLNDDPNRNQLTNECYSIATKNYKLDALFKELQRLPVKKYTNIAAVSIRIFFELAITDYIIRNDLKNKIIGTEKKGYNEIPLNKKVQFCVNYIDDKAAKKVIDMLLAYQNDYSLNTLNNYVHGTEVTRIDAEFLNRFWGALIPLFAVLIDMKEI